MPIDQLFEALHSILNELPCWKTVFTSLGLGFSAGLTCGFFKARHRYLYKESILGCPILAKHDPTGSTFHRPWLGQEVKGRVKVITKKGKVVKVLCPFIQN